MEEYHYRDEEWLREQYWGNGQSTGQIAERCDVDRSTIVRWLNRHDIETRDKSEIDWSEVTAKAREAIREKYGEGGYLSKLWEENRDEQTKVARQNAHKGTPAREKNGMAGATGQDNPNWRGGKNVYDAVKKQLPNNWREVREESKRSDGYLCQNCGAIGKPMHSHHIVPLLSGGTNEGWNAMTLCRSCHSKAERYIRQYPEFEPVLVE